MNFVGDYYQKRNLKLMIITSLKYFVKSLSKDPKWRLTDKGYKHGNNKNLQSLKATVSYSRLTASFYYVSETS